MRDKENMKKKKSTHESSSGPVPTYCIDVATLIIKQKNYCLICCEMCAADITADEELCRKKADQNKVELTWTNIEKSDESIVKDTLQWTLQCREKEEREIEGLFSTIQQYSCGNCEQQHKVEGCQKGTRPIIAGHPL